MLGSSQELRLLLQALPELRYFYVIVGR